MLEFVVLCIIVWLFRLHSSSRSSERSTKNIISNALNRIDEIERRLDALERRADVPASAPASHAVPEPCDREPLSVEPAQTVIFAGEVQPAAAEQPQEVMHEADVSPEIHEPAPPVDQRSSFERIFIENWTGILGAVVVVAGISFIGIYTALKFGPFYRFLMTSGVAAAFAIASIFLRRREYWLALSRWVRSAGAAIFLFACAASGGLPGLGLQWVDQPLPAFALLMLGMAVNLRLAWTGGSQKFASLHVILSLLPMMIVPQSVMSLAIATAVSLFGVMLSFRARWDQHLLIVIAAYAVYHVFWYLRIGEASAGALSAIVLFLTAAMVHHRKAYASQVVEGLPLLVHLCNWLFLSLALFAYLAEPLPRGIALALTGLVAALLARRARSLGISWLHLCDTLIAESLVVAALASLYPLVANDQIFMLTLFVETLLFMRLVIDEDEELLRLSAWVAANAMGLLFAIVGMIDIANEGLRNQNALIMIAGAATATVTLIYLMRRHGERMRALAEGWLTQDAMGWIIGLIVTASLLNLADGNWMETAALLSVGSMILISRFFAPPGIVAGAGIALCAAHLLSSVMLLDHMPWEAALLARHVLPLAALAAIAILLSDKLRQVSIWLLGLYLALAAYLFFDPVSPLIPGVAWLLLSLAALELSKSELSKSESSNRVGHSSSILYLGYLYLAAFVAAYALVIIQTTAYFGYLPVRLLIELLGLGVIIYWYLYHPRQEIGHRERLNLQPYFLEFCLIAVTTINIVEVPEQWRPITWSLFSLMLLVRPLAGLDQRFRFYSMIFYWVAVADVAVVMSTFESPSSSWYYQPDTMSLIAIALQVTYIVMQHRIGAFAAIGFPSGLGAFATLSGRIGARRNLWVYYPFLTGVALFLYWRFDHSMLTLLWAAEAFTVFVLSALLRENQFRHIALVGLGACMLRLLLIDMAEANLALRGMVFIGVGFLMLGMNAIYNRYRERFQ